MPRLAQPGSILWRMRLQYTTRRKLALLMMPKHLQDEEGISLHRSAEHVQVSALLLTKWVEHFSLGNDPIEAMLKNKKKSIQPPSLRQMKPLEEALIKYIFEQHKQGIKVNTLCILMLASNLSTKIDEKHFAVRCSAIKLSMR